MTPATEIQVIEQTAIDAVNEAVAVEAEVTPAAPTLYPLDDQMIEIALKKGAIALRHRLRRPTAHELHEREQLIEHEVNDLNDEEIETTYDTDRGDRRLWERCVVDVAGYRTSVDLDPHQWQPATAEIKARMPAGHKEAAVSAYLASAFGKLGRLEEEDAFNLLGAPEARVQVFITGTAHCVTHVVRQPTEEEWSRYDRQVSQSTQIKGAKRRRVRLRNNCLAAIRLYDEILLRIEGASLGSLGWANHMRDQFVASVEPLHKIVVISVLANDYGAQLQD